MTKIYLIRHGEAEGNAYRRFHGHYDSLLTKNGYAQVRALEKRFENIPVDACFSSDLIRTSLTARAVYVPKGLPLQRDPAFREVGVGVIEDVPFGYLEYVHPGMVESFDRDPVSWSIEGGEVFPDFTGRFLRRLREIAAEYEGKTVAIFTHGAMLRCVTACLFYTPEESGRIPYGDNTAVTEITYNNGEFSLEYYADASHLTDDITTRCGSLWERRKKLGGNLWFAPAEGTEAFLQEIGVDGKACAAVAAGEREAFVLAMFRDQPVGYMLLDPKLGRLEKLFLVEKYEGLHMEDQILGHGVSFLRARGFREIRSVPMPESDLLARYDFKPRGEELVMNIDTTCFSWDSASAAK